MVVVSTTLSFTFLHTSHQYTMACKSKGDKTELFFLHHREVSHLARSAEE